MLCENKKDLIKIISSAALLVCAYIINFFISLPMWAQLLTYIPSYLIVGFEVLRGSAEGIFDGEIFGEDLLMSLATIGALVIGFLPDGEPMFAEAVFVMLFFSVGEMFEELSEEKSRRSIAELMDIRPDSANVIRNGVITVVAPNEVAVGEIISVRAGERIPLDGVIVSGESSLNTVALTGESAPRDVKQGDEVISGCINLSGAIEIKTEKEYGESTVSKILELVENASSEKSDSERFITGFARCYTPIVVISAVMLAVIPPIIAGDFAKWLVRALTFLVVSCPCALVISVPLAFFCGIGHAACNGILIKGGEHLSKLANVGTAVFDKTGTLTKGVFEVTAVHPNICDENTLLHLAAHVERHSTHPIAISLRQAYQNEADDCSITKTREIPGKGVIATVNGKEVAVGNTSLMEETGAKWWECRHTGTIIHISTDGEYAGHIVVSDKIKEDAATAISSLKSLGIDRTVMLTGDRKEVAEETAKALCIDEYAAELLPADKVKEIERLYKSNPPNKALMFVGDGINDAPVLARSDIGVAMGALGSDAAIEAANVVIMDDKPSKLAESIKHARFTLKLVKENIIFALTVKFSVLVLAAFGLAPMWLAVFADVGVAVIAVMNSTRKAK